MNARTTRWFGLTALLGLLGAACTSTVDTPGEEDVSSYKQALPRKDLIQIKLPGAMLPDAQASSPADGTGQSSQALVGQQAEFYLVTRDISQEVNHAAYHWLSIVDDITDLPPTVVIDDTAYWGPHTPALSLITFMFELTDDGGGDYRYALLGKVKNQPNDTYLPLMLGTHTPIAPGVGHGTMALDFDARNSLDPSLPELGLIELAYADFGVFWVLDAHFDDFEGEHTTEPVNALYHYRENADQSGDFSFLAHEDLQDNGSALETWTMRSRWLAGGSGRGDAVIVGGDLGNVELNATECWDEMFARTYWVTDPPIEPEEGDPDSCVFGPPSEQ